MEQQALTYWLELPGRRYGMRVVKGDESMSRTFRFELTFPVDPSDGFSPDKVLRSEAILTLDRVGEERRITGVITQVSRKASRSGNTGAGEIVAILEPRLALLKKRQDIRVFRDKTVPEIVRHVVAHVGISVDLRLRSAYKRRPYCVQFRETDYDFVARLLEDEGIYYFIDDADNLVIGDAPAGYDDPIGFIPYRHNSGLDIQRDAVTVIGQRGSMTAGKVSLRDFNHEHPRLNMDVSAAGPTEGGAEWYDYPGEYELPAEGQVKAKLRAEALRCVHHRFTGRSFCGAFRPGVVFLLTNAPTGVADRGYVITQVSHDWSLDKTAFENEFEALPDDVTYRPPVVTPAPVETNPLTGFVTGPAGADIHTDHWGRIKVHFPWDRLQPKDDNCSHWVPVLQDNTGHSSAMSRTGWEVLCHFMEGDPDRPVVVGRVYNPDDPFYSPLPDRKMRIALRSLSSPRVEGSDTAANFIQFDDFAGHESIVMHAQKDQNVVVLNTKQEQVDNTESLVVKGNERIQIGADQKIQVKGSMLPEVLGNQTRVISGSHQVDVGGSETETVEQNHTMTIGGAHKRIMGTADTTFVSGNMKETVGAVVLEGSAKTNTFAGEKTNTMLVGGAVVELFKGNKAEASGLAKLEAIGGLVFSKAGKVMATRVEMLRSTVVGGILRIDSMKSMLFAGLVKLSKKALSASYEGSSEITLKVGETEVIFKDGLIDMNAPKSITIETTAKNRQAATKSTQI